MKPLQITLINAIAPVCSGLIALAYWTDGYRYPASIFSSPLFHRMMLSLLITAAVFVVGTQIAVRIVPNHRRALITASVVASLSVFIYWFLHLMLEFAGA